MLSTWEESYDKIISNQICKTIRVNFINYNAKSERFEFSKNCEKENKIEKKRILVDDAIK